MREPIYLILCTVFYLIYLNTLSAQGLNEKGIKGGINFSKFIGDDADLGPIDVTREFTTTFAIGGYLTFGINEQFSIRPETYYSVKGCLYKESKGKDEKLTISMSYIDIPVLGVFQLVEDFSLFVGPSLGIYLSGETKFEAYGQSETSDLEDLLTLTARIYHWYLVPIISSNRSILMQDIYLD
jgi:hypothetical protein